jgi:hypothetical protein
MLCGTMVCGDSSRGNLSLFECPARSAFVRENANRANRVHDVGMKSHAIFNKQNTDVTRHRCVLLVVFRVLRQTVLLGRVAGER